MSTTVDEAPPEDSSSVSARGRRRLVNHETTRALWPALFVALVLTVGTSLVFRSSWVANDDGTMIAFANGDYAAPDGHLVFIHTFVGWALVASYRLLPDVSWYSWLLLALWTVSWGTVIHTGVATSRFRLSKILTGCLVVLGLPFTVLPITFTAAAIGLATAGLLLLLEGTRDPSRLRLPLLVAGGSFVIIASMVRWHSVQAIGLAFLPVFVLAARRVGLRRSAIFTVAVGTLVLGLRFADRLTYASEPWRSFLEFNDPRGELHGTMRLMPSDELTPVLAEHGWTENDLFLFRKFVYADPAVYTTEAVKAIRDHTRFEIPDGKRDRIEKAWTMYRDLVKRAGLVFLVAGVALGSWRARAWYVVSGIWYVAVLSALAVFVRLPYRLGTSLLVLAPIVAIVMADQLREERSPSRRDLSERRRPVRVEPWAFTALAALIAVGALVHSIDDGLRSARIMRDLAHHQRALLAQEHETLRGVDPDGIFVGQGSRLSYEYGDPLEAKTSFGDLRYIELGWATFSPPYERRLEELGITDVYADLALRSHLYLVASRAIKNSLEIYYQEHRGWLVEFEEVAPLDEGAVVWRVSTAVEAASGQPLTD